MAVLGEQPIWCDQEYELAKHCLVVERDEGKIILNELTRSIVFLENSEIEDLTNIDKYLFLYKNYFLVPKGFNSNKLVDNIRKISLPPIDDVYLNHPWEFTILTTTKCNARCFYCYEKDSKGKHDMSNQTALSIAKYIDDVAPNTEIRLDWFGGEPLFNQKAIDLIVNYLAQKGRTFTSNITTNGYLFDEKLLEKALNKWKLGFAQVTIDGTEKTYNKAKNYIYKKDSSPYQRVMNNIQMLLDSDIHVAIRINLDNYNIEDSKKLVQEIYERFGIRDNLNIYLYPIFEEESNKRSAEDEKLLYEGLFEIEELIVSLGFRYDFYPSEQIKTNHCMADSGTHVLISPDGDLGTCEHFINKDFFGNINSTKKDYNILNGWREYEEPTYLCEDCPIYADCTNPVKCFERHKCTEYVKEWKIRKASYQLVNFYNMNKYECNQTI